MVRIYITVCINRNNKRGTHEDFQVNWNPIFYYLPWFWSHTRGCPLPAHHLPSVPLPFSAGSGSIPFPHSPPTRLFFLPVQPPQPVLPLFPTLVQSQPPPQHGGGGIFICSNSSKCYLNIQGSFCNASTNLSVGIFETFLFMFPKPDFSAYVGSSPAFAETCILATAGLIVWMFWPTRSIPWLLDIISPFLSMHSTVQMFCHTMI